MPIDFSNSQTKDNLLRAFAGESQARNRYTFAASLAKKQNLEVIQAIFTFTAGQEKEHAEIFYNYLSEFSGQNLNLNGTYPIDKTNDVLQALRFAEHNEFEEYSDAYKSFAQTATDEGFADIANSFNMIAEIERNHHDRFKLFADLLEQNKLFVSDTATGWMCLNCGNIVNSTSAPQICPVCKHNQGYFIMLELAPYSKQGL
ncbi:MAG: rubrerythrin family protein [Clostridiales bacterium]|nr:rubrerythrin family protein [Clostridiales bacterium]